VPGFFYSKSVGLAGKRSGGKSLFVSWFAAQASRGGYIDSAGHEKSCQPMNVWINVVGEDPVEKMWHPRLRLAGADFDRVRVTEYHYLLPQSLGALRDRLRDFRAEGFPVDILILESVGTHLKNPHFGFENNRRAMSGLVTMGEELDLTIIMACHFRKGRASTVESAISGQGVLQATSKAIYVVSSYPAEASPTRVLACERLNGPMPTSLLFELKVKNVPEAKAAHPFLRYVGPIDVTARDVYNASRAEEKGSGATGVAIAAEWIREHVAGRVIKVADLEATAQEAEVWFSRSTFKRARDEAGLRTISDAKARELLGAEYDFAAGDADGRTRIGKPTRVAESTRRATVGPIRAGTRSPSTDFRVHGRRLEI
jgi:hypothetical protein